MKKFLKIVLLILLLLILAAGIALLVVYNSWPWWLGLAIGGGLLGIWLLMLFLRKFLLRMREKKFVQQIIAQDQAAIECAPAENRQELLNVQDKWKKSVELLKQSHIRKKGNPLYVLPWYIVLGDAGSGKTSAIRNTKLSSPLTEVSRASGISGTRDFDWWFFEDSIILDTAGRYAVPVDGERDIEEWEAFLAQLARYRKKEPLNGAVVTISADNLLSHSPEELSEQGQHFRRRIDQLMRACGARFPIYIMITKTDLVHGMTAFCELLPPEMHQQVLGYANEDLTLSWRSFLDQAMATMVKRFKDLRLLLVQKDPDADPGVLMFPSEFASLQEGITGFAKGIFSENPYQETPLFRGLFFSSAVQHGVPSSDFLRTYDIKSAKNDIRGNKTTGLFLYDFFKQVLPFDRYLFSPILEFLKWRRATISIGTAGWWLTCLALGALITFAYLSNVAAISSFSKEFSRLPAIEGDTANRLISLNQLRMKIDEVSRHNQYWWVPRLGLRYSQQAEQQLKTHYADQFNRQLLTPLDRQLQRTITMINNGRVLDDRAGYMEDLKAGYVDHLVTRIHLLDTFLDHGVFSKMDGMADRSARIFEYTDPEMLMEIAVKFGPLYMDALKWTKNRYLVSSNLKELEVSLARLLKAAGPALATADESGQTGYDMGNGNLHWLVYKKIPGVAPIRMEDYWGWPDDNTIFAGSLIIPAAYTRAGKEHLEAFIGRIQDVMAERDPEFTKTVQEFWHWYRLMYYKTWADFADQFSTGTMALEDAEDWTTMAVQMTSGENPCFDLFMRMAGELEAFDDHPPWAEGVLEMRQAMEMTPPEADETGQKGLIESLKSKGSRAYQKTLDTADPERARLRRNRLSLAKTWKDYRQSFEDLTPATASPYTAFKMAKGVFPFGTAPAESNSPFYTTHQFLFLMENQLGKLADTSVAIPLLAGPFRFTMDYITRESAFVLQEKWENEVLARIQGATPERVPQMLFKKSDGLIWKFLDGPAAPFVGRDQDGFYAHQALGKRLPIRPSLFSYITMGAEATVTVQPEYTVNIRALPVDFNKESRVQPYAAIIELACAGKKIRLVNYNYPEAQTFKWSMDSCGDTVVQILLPDITLEKRYNGLMGFARFLKEFQDGVKRFKPSDFPGQADYLKNQDIQWITLSLEIDGGEPVIKLLKGLPTDVPKQIVDTRF
ncbi:MAG: type VI secretion protein IcmF/TssM N-terminal domain-containing protein [Thermodesulfobacteriota bacterium]|nr:type VI secretion protein IcmF/TssM N-terminal domain-containing protein [Thermodesulfobacteriota bacterium]